MIPTIIILITIACAVTVAIAAPINAQFRKKSPVQGSDTGSRIIFVASPIKIRQKWRL